MLKRKSIILSLLVVAFLSFPQSAHIVGAESQTLNILHTGSITAECILLQKQNPPIYIKVIRNNSDLCAKKVVQYNNDECTEEAYKGEEISPTDDKSPTTRAYGIGNNICPESIVVYNSKPCYEYDSGGNTRYIPKG